MSEFSGVISEGRERMAGTKPKTSGVGSINTGSFILFFLFFSVNFLTDT